MSRAKNPGAQTLAQWTRAVNSICRTRDQKKGLCSRSNDAETKAAVALIRSTPAAKRAEFAKQQGSRRGKYRNPEEIVTRAEELYEAFTGRPSDSVELIEQRVHYPKNLADLGELRELQVILPGGKSLATIGFSRKGVHVGAAGIQHDSRGIFGTEIHFAGGNQTLDLAKLGAGHLATKPTLIVGELYRITYFTSKHFHDFVPSEYEHELGEETGERPHLGYDPRSKLMFLSGGAYEVRPEGITN